MAHPQKFISLVETARSEIKETDVSTVQQRLNNGEQLNIVDVREDNEWVAGHIPNATHLGKGIIECKIENVFPDPTVELILYCGGGYRSALAAASLQKMGYSNVISMNGGFRDWHQSGCDITR